MKKKIKLSVLKYNAIKLRSDYQLPYKLVYFITLLNNDTRSDLVTLLMNMSEHYLRVKGYYKKYPQVEKTYNEVIENEVKKFGL